MLTSRSIFSFVFLCSLHAIAMEKPTVSILCNDGEVVEVDEALVPQLGLLKDIQDLYGYSNATSIPLPVEQKSFKIVVKCLKRIQYIRTRNEMMLADNRQLFAPDIGNNYIPHHIEWAIYRAFRALRLSITADELVKLIQVAHYVQAPVYLLNEYVRRWVENIKRFDSTAEMTEYAESVEIPLAVIDDYVIKHWKMRRNSIYQEYNIADRIAENDCGVFQVDIGPTLYLTDALLTSLDGIEYLEHNDILQQLFLHSNNLTTIRIHDFQAFSELTELNLANNRLKLVDCSAFQHLVKLRYLNVSKNRLKAIDPTPLQKLAVLEYFFFEGNKLTRGNEELIRQALPGVKYTRWIK